MELNKQKLLALSYILHCCSATKKYREPEAIKDLIVLSDAGTLFLEELKKLLPEETENRLFFGLLLHLYHKEFWIDADQTDVNALFELVDKQLFDQELNIPWVFGRDLYDNYARLFVTSKEELTVDETSQLLEGTPQGVAQIGEFIFGPFGITTTDRARRAILPEKKLPLWHCNDLGCERLHEMELNIRQVPAYQIALEIHELARHLLGDGTDWWGKFTDSFPYKNNYYDDPSIRDLASVLITCLSMPELKTLCSELFLGNSSFVRAAIKSRGLVSNLFKGSTSVIANKMTKEQCLQVLLMFSDKEIVNSLEKLIYEGKIVVPPAELRTPKLGGRGRSGWLRLYSEISQFGFRRVSANRADIEIAIGRLRKLVLDFYQERKIPEKTLLYCLRFSTGDGALQKLDNFINDKDPRAVLTDLISIHENGLIDCLEYLEYGYAPELRTADDEADFIDKILWKLGFTVPPSPQKNSRLDVRLDLLLAASREIANSSEAEREKTRSAAVNLFVSLEENLDLTLSYSSWMFFSDHFSGSRFRFKLSDGRKVASTYLGGKKIGDNSKLELKTDGKNTLFPLIEGLSVLAKQIRSMRKKSSRKYVRPSSALPGYAGKNSLENFPFVHSLFLFDIKENDVEACASSLDEAVKMLRVGKICEVRNRLEHKREDFPTRDEIERCCDGIASAMKKLISTGLLPTEYHRLNTNVDRYGRQTRTYENQAGHKIAVNWYPSHLLSYDNPSDGPIAITPQVHIGDSSDIFYADIVVSSDYVDMWKDYPKRRIAAEVGSPASPTSEENSTQTNQTAT
jgi:hypothetical protein